MLMTSLPSQRLAEALLRDILKVSLLSGMRQSEIVLMRVGDVEPDGAGGLVFSIKEGKTQAAVRRVPVHSQLQELVRERRYLWQTSSEVACGVGRG